MNVETLNKYYENGLLCKQTHPTLPLTIWNYSEKVQYEGLWDEVTVQCRGLITENTTGKVLVRPFAKFFNYEEVVDKNVIPLKGDYVYVQEKMDGSLGILFYYEGEWIMATRGSFTSEQAIRGMEILKKRYPVFDRSWLQEYAYLVELIYPENRIVVDYGKEKITFLSAVLNEGFTGWKPTDETELHWTMACSIFAANGIKKSDIVKTEQHFNFSDKLYKSLKEKNENNKEGFVLRFFPGNFRMKIKFEDYVRLHKIMTNISTTAVWEVLSNGGTMDDLLKDVPDEFYDKIREYENKLVGQHDTLMNEYQWIFNKIRNVYFETHQKEFNRPEFAELAKRYKHPSLLFGLLDGKDVSPTIWKLIRPEFCKL
jgi:RNA ligase